MSRRRREGTTATRADRPSYEARAPLDLREIPPPPQLMDRLLNARNSYLRAYELGPCSVIVTREDGRWHLSIANPKRYPTWDEVAEARYRILPDGVTMAMLLPPKEEYINIHENCFQMHQIEGREGGG